MSDIRDLGILTAAKAITAIKLPSIECECVFPHSTIDDYLGKIVGHCRQSWDAAIESSFPSIVLIGFEFGLADELGDGARQR
jgi:hypothetical protein